MTAVSRCARWLMGIAAVVALTLSLPGLSGAQAPGADEFHVGDRIAVTVDGGPQPISDTLTVREGLIVRLPGLADVPLTGVKRAGIQSYLTQQIGKFIKDPIVHATALVRIAVLGQVMRPGFYTVPSDMLLSDVVMSAGGPTGNADLTRSVVTRGSSEVITQDSVASALSGGMTLDQLRVAPGDQLVVGEKPGSGWDTVLKVVGVAVPLLTLALYFSSKN